MKHTLQVTLILVILFFSAQLIGLLVTKNYLQQPALPYNFERPELEEETSFIPVFITILIATFLILILIKFKAMTLWKYWFFIGIVFTLIISFFALLRPILGQISVYIATFLAILFAIFKVFRSNIFIHNFTELFIYGGLAGIFVPLFNLLSISILLILISLYDFIAVRKTKHMVSIAKFESKSKIFAGLFIPYGNKEAILGGGDIGFPLLFAGVVLKIYGVLPAIITITFTSLALLYLFAISKKNKFYPAMPFLTAGCFLGFLVSLLL